jgi:hypothetical protein
MLDHDYVPKVVANGDPMGILWITSIFQWRSRTICFEGECITMISTNDLYGIAGALFLLVMGTFGDLLY